MSVKAPWKESAGETSHKVSAKTAGGATAVHSPRTWASKRVLVPVACVSKAMRMEKPARTCWSVGLAPGALECHHTDDGSGIQDWDHPTDQTGDERERESSTDQSQRQ